MARLADIDSQIRTLGKIAAVGAVALVLLFIVIMGGSFIKNTLFPTPPAPPEEKFGALPIVSFPGQDSKKLTYTISTLTGDIPTLPGRVSPLISCIVYFCLACIIPYTCKRSSCVI